MSKGKILAIIVVLLLAGGGMAWKSLFEHIDQDTILCVQDPIDGELHWYFNAGLKPQFFGTVTLRPKRFIMDHSQENPFKIRFADAAHAEVYASVEYAYPRNAAQMSVIHGEYGSHQELVDRLLEPNLSKCIYTSGPTMTSQESFALKRNDLLNLIIDQMKQGVYKTRQREERTVDPVTGLERTRTFVDIVVDESGNPVRQEKGQLNKFGIKPMNLRIARLKYDEAVESQIQQQRKLLMDIQVAVAQAKEAEQRALTVAKEGEAHAMKKKWEQEAIKAEQVTIAERELAVQELATEKAVLYKREQILIGEGEAERKRLAMAADGALIPKLATYEKVMDRWAQAWENYDGPLVPTMIMGQSGNHSAGSNLQDFITLMTAGAAKDLALDMKMKGSNP